MEAIVMITGMVTKDMIKDIEMPNKISYIVEIVKRYCFWVSGELIRNITDFTVIKNLKRNNTYFFMQNIAILIKKLKLTNWKNFLVGFNISVKKYGWASFIFHAILSSLLAFIL